MMLKEGFALPIMTMLRFCCSAAMVRRRLADVLSINLLYGCW